MAKDFEFFDGFDGFDAKNDAAIFVFGLSIKLQKNYEISKRLHLDNKIKRQVLQHLPNKKIEDVLNNLTSEREYNKLIFNSQAVWLLQ